MSILGEPVESLAFKNLSLFNIPHFVEIYVTPDWQEIISQNSSIQSNWEISRLIYSLDVQICKHNPRNRFLTLQPDISKGMTDKEKEQTLDQLFTLYHISDACRIFAGADSPVESIYITFDRRNETISNFNPYSQNTLKSFIEGLRPVLDQEKHTHEERQVGGKKVSAFSAYDKNDDSYARTLLQIAYEDHPGNVDDRTYLYTYDEKNDTFVEFRPDRNKRYHGRDIDMKTIAEKSPYIKKKFNK